MEAKHFWFAIFWNENSIFEKDLASDVESRLKAYR